MPNMLAELTPEPLANPSSEAHFRPLYVRRVPEAIWILVHENAIRSRMRLQEYIVELLKECEPMKQ